MTIALKIGVAALAIGAVATAAQVVPILRGAADLEASIRTTADAAHEALTLRLDREAADALAVAAQVARDPRVQAAYAARDRAALTRAAEPAYRDLQRAKPSTEQFQFFTGDRPARGGEGQTRFTTAFLRMQAPDRHGDDVSAWRHTMSRAIEAPCGTFDRGFRGLELSSSGIAMHGVVPVCHEGRNVGALNVGYRLDRSLFDAIARETRLSYALYLPADLTNGQLSSPPAFRSLLRSGQLAFDAARHQFATVGTTHERPFVDAAAKAVAFAGEPRLAMIDTPAGRRWVGLYPVRNFAGETVGVVEIAGDASAFAAREAQGWMILALMALLIFAAAGGLWFYVRRVVVRPIEAIAATVEAITRGDTASTVPGLDRQDEIGAIARAVESARVAEIQSAAASQEAGAVEARQRARAAAIEADIAAFRGEVETMIAGLVARLDEARGTAAGLDGVARRAHEDAMVMRNVAVETTSSVGSVATASEELSASIGEIARQVERARAIAGEADAAAARTNEEMRGLDEAASRIGNIVTLIQAIAEQTNLLALNATIEAARAGEAGRGFAVVASEVKSLATQTAKATGDISGQIAGIQGSAREAARAIERITATIAEVGGVTAAIATAVDQQSGATREIAGAAEAASSGAGSLQTRIDGVAGAIGETTRAADLVAATTGELRREADRLRGVVNGFLARVAA